MKGVALVTLQSRQDNATNVTSTPGTSDVAPVTDTSDPLLDYLDTLEPEIATVDHAKRSPERIKQAINALLEGKSLRKAAQACGVDHTTLLRWGQKDQTLARALHHAKRLGADWYEDAARGIIEGTVQTGATGAIAIGLKLRGKLLENKAPPETGDRVVIEQVVSTAQGTIRQRFQVQRGSGQLAPGTASAQLPATVDDGAKGGRA